MSLLEREEALAAIEEALADARGGSGRVVLVTGEAGIGKTVVVHEIALRMEGRARILAGACDPLLTPRALGPVLLGPQRLPSRRRSDSR